MTDALFVAAGSDGEVLLMIFGFVVLLVAGVALPIWASALQTAGAVRELQALAAALKGGVAAGETGFWTDLTACHAAGQLEGRDVRVSFARRGAGKHSYTAIVYELEVRHPAATFEVAEVDFLQGLGRFLGLTSEDALDDGDLVLRAGGQRAGRLLQASDVKAALKQVLGLQGVTAVSLKGTTLRFEQRGPITAESMQRALRTLLELARLCDRIPVADLKVTVRPREAAQAPPLAARFAWTGGGETARCPYCRDELDAAAPEAATCERCGTVHHRECLDEAGGCTVFGCGAKDRGPAERARA